MELLSQQTKAISKLLRYKVGALFMEPGTGKTRTAWELIKTVTGVDYILWLTPFQTKHNLLVELNKIGANTSIIDIQGIESLSNSDNLYLKLHTKLRTTGTAFIVVDESLKIKNWQAKRTKRIIELGKLAQYKLVLNGTPLSRNMLDLWPQMEFLSPRILKMQLPEYKNTFIEYTTITKRIGYQQHSREFINKYHNVDYLFKLIEPYVFESNLQLNHHKQYINHTYTLTPEEHEEHNTIKAKYLDDERMRFLRNNIFLEITQKLQHNYSCSPDKFEVVDRILSKNNQSKIIIYAKYVDTQAELHKRYPKVTVLSWQKHAFGLNLQYCNLVIFFDKVWDYALRDQAEHRVFRIGQQSDCYFHDLTGNVGLEDLINKNISKKQSMLQYFKKKSAKELMKEL